MQERLGLDDLDPELRRVALLLADGDARRIEVVSADEVRIWHQPGGGTLPLFEL
ncbi:hypothetical protein [Saccharothrix sp. HUAS TT1]|uniref:hypothetical protein n=1 Tax=unclassified Saccharothrix TaxID=2593673 RepID=UPI00345B8346